MYMVCLLHTLGQGGLLQAAAPGSAGFALLWLLEVLAYCAVDGFAMISGFTASDRPQKYVKIVDMWFQVFFYSFVVLVIFTLLGVTATRGARLHHGRAARAGAAVLVFQLVLRALFSCSRC